LPDTTVFLRDKLLSEPGEKLGRPRRAVSGHDKKVWRPLRFLFNQFINPGLRQVVNAAARYHRGR